VVRAVRHHRHLAHARLPPSSWSGYAPTLVEIATLIGSFGLFFTLFLLFCRYVPMIAASEVKACSCGAKPTEPR